MTDDPRGKNIFQWQEDETISRRLDAIWQIISSPRSYSVHEIRGALAALCDAVSLRALPPTVPSAPEVTEREFTVLNAAELADEYMGREVLRDWSEYERALLRNFARWLPKGIRGRGLTIPALQVRAPQQEDSK